LKFQQEIREVLAWQRGGCQTRPEKHTGRQNAWRGFNWIWKGCHFLRTVKEFHLWAGSVGLYSFINLFTHCFKYKFQVPRTG